jgi:hypothetical protein
MRSPLVATQCCRKPLKPGGCATTGARFLDRRTRHRPVGAKDAAIARLGAQERAAAAAFVKKPTGVGRHRLEVCRKTPWTSDQRLVCHQPLGAEG